MTKCTFCIEDVDAGRQPSCVSACPMRALDFGTPEELAARHPHAAPGGEGIYPMPDASLTRPNLLVTPHPALARAAAGTGPVLEIGNVEET
jgi:anaerobic dimethyl sulfoxide reductase subunit B (iron-sulfur subunit)